MRTCSSKTIMHRRIWTAAAGIFVLIASMAHDDPEGWHYLEVTERHRAEDPDVFLLSNIQGVGNLDSHADFAEFDGANVRPVNVRPLCKVLLR